MAKQKITSAGTIEDSENEYVFIGSGGPIGEETAAGGPSFEPFFAGEHTIVQPIEGVQ